MWLIAVERSWIGRNVLGNKYPAKRPDVSKNLGNFIVGQLLENLANQAQIGRGQWIAGDIRTLKADPGIVHGAFMMFNQFRDYVDAGVAHAGRLDNAPPDNKVATTQIDYALHLMVPNKFDNGSTVLF